MASAIDAPAFERHLRSAVPLCDVLGIRAEDVGAGRARLRLPYAPLLLRPGGIVCGPALMALADAAMYAAVMSLRENGALATTLSLTTHFLRRAPPGDLLAEAQVLTLDGARVVGVVDARSEDDPRPVAHFTCTYMLPGAPDVTPSGSEAPR